MPYSYSTDVPTRQPIHRRGNIRARVNSNLYLVDVYSANGSVCAALYDGSGVLALASDVTLEFDPTIPAWWII